MRADLHTHSSRSDGVLAPAELVRQAHVAGLDCLALTDHDSIAGIAEAALAARALGLRLIAGVEL
jgi:predicted metal-dependent phosphoesterase TrpH